MMVLGLVVASEIKKNGTKGVWDCLGLWDLLFGLWALDHAYLDFSAFSLFPLSFGYGHLGVGNDRWRWTCDCALDMYATVHQHFDIHTSARYPLS